MSEFIVIAGRASSDSNRGFLALRSPLDQRKDIVEAFCNQGNNVLQKSRVLMGEVIITLSPTASDDYSEMELDFRRIDIYRNPVSTTPEDMLRAADQFGKFIIEHIASDVTLDIVNECVIVSGADDLFELQRQGCIFSDRVTT